MIRFISAYSHSVIVQAAQLEMFGPKDSDSFEGLGLAKTLADHLLGAFSIELVPHMILRFLKCDCHTVLII